uniref:Uncharacterized protein n=1 Tax=Arundo donax TaxID=35708 RepID=A0A0A8YVP2_ARUDO
MPVPSAAVRRHPSLILRRRTPCARWFASKKTALHQLN